jgi:AcrR family transcriptional regulator
MSDLPHTIEAVSVRDRLLDAAVRVVAREGVGNLTLSAVAQEAGVSKGGLLYHFPAKSQLVTGVVERLAARCEGDQLKALAGEEGRAGGFTRAYLSIRSEPLNPDEEPIHCALLAAAGTDRELLEPFRKRILEWQARLENDGIDPAVASVIRLAIDGLCLGALLGIPVPKGEMRKKVLEKLFAMSRCKGPSDSTLPRGP